jgi:hypothetical protein
MIVEKLSALAVLAASNTGWLIALMVPAAAVDRRRLETPAHPVFRSHLDRIVVPGSRLGPGDEWARLSMIIGDARARAQLVERSHAEAAASIDAVVSELARLDTELMAIGTSIARRNRTEAPVDGIAVMARE